MVKVRSYKESDYEQVKSNLIENEMFEEAWDNKLNLKEKIKRNQNSILVAVEKNKVVGNLFIVADGWNAYIFRLVVAKKFQGKGIGSLLLEKAEGICKEMGIPEVCLLVNSKSEKLQEWYKKKGYVIDPKTYHEATKKL